MKLTSTLISLAALVSVTYADIQPVRPNSYYDNGATSMNSVACSNGVNGLVTKGYPTFGSLPNFPHIGSSFAVGGWNSTECGSCWELTYAPNGITIYIVALDTVYSGFGVSDDAMNTLTDGVPTDVLDVEATQVAEHYCALPSTV
ncbi:Cerato-platanin domain containing protein [Lactarius tabidus]